MSDDHESADSDKSDEQNASSVIESEVEGAAGAEEEEQFRKTLGAELESAKSELTKDSEENEAASVRELRLRSWQVASDLVRDFKPVPWIVWKLIRSVLGKPNKVGKVHSIAFDPVDRLIFHACGDVTLTHHSRVPEDHQKVTINRAIEMIGPDVAVAVCFIHCVCRRVAAKVGERVWRPILEDALLRARIGFFVCGYCEEFGRGRGMLAGFAGRLGLAMQISSGDMIQAQHTLEALATGIDINEAGLKNYGCDPLQVAALSLTAAGCSRESALGVANYSSGEEEVDSDSEQYKWLAAFSICEHLRMGAEGKINPRHWRALKVDSDAKNEVLKQNRLMQRKGSGWQWMTWPLVALDKPEVG